VSGPDRAAQLAAEFSDDPIMAALMSPSARPSAPRRAPAVPPARGNQVRPRPPVSQPPRSQPPSQAQPDSQADISVGGDDAIAAALAQIQARRSVLATKRAALEKEVAKLAAQDVRLADAQAALQPLQYGESSDDSAGVSVGSYKMIRAYAITLAPGRDGTARVDPDAALRFARLNNWSHADRPVKQQREHLVGAMATLSRRGDLDKREGVACYHTWPDGHEGGPGVHPIIAGQGS
jgi:hypothetical protein